VTYYNDIGDIAQESLAGSTFSHEFTNVATYPFYMVCAQTNGTCVSCRLFVNGQLVSSNTATGQELAPYSSPLFCPLPELWSAGFRDLKSRRSACGE
jgi:hypothetical protein